jgi:D-alanine-D-alanine ligase
MTDYYYDVKKYGRIGVLMGGISGEREISLKSGKAVLKALRDSHCDAVEVDIDNPDPGLVRSLLAAKGINLAFNVLHGRFGEDGRIQEILNGMNIPFPGSGVRASEQSFHKIQTQKILKSSGIPVPPFIAIDRGQPDAVSVIKKHKFDLPLVVKPDDSGSSLGVAVARDWEQCADACRRAFAISDNILVDRFIPGREMTVGILADEALPVIEIRPRHSFFDFTAKYQKGSTEYVLPAPVSEKLSGRIKSMALKVYKTLGCEDFSRVDFMVGPGDRPHVLEINTLPGFTSTSLLPMAAEYQGISFNELCLQLVDMAYGKKKAKQDTLAGY